MIITNNKRKDTIYSYNDEDYEYVSILERKNIIKNITLDTNSIYHDEDKKNTSLYVYNNSSRYDNIIHNDDSKKEPYYNLTNLESTLYTYDIDDYDYMGIKN